VQEMSPRGQECPRHISAGLSYAVGVDKDLAGFAGLEALHGFAEIFHGDAVGDDGMKIQLAAFEQRRHLIPGLIHAASVDALDGDAFEDDVFGEVQRDGLGGETEEGDAAAASDDVEGCSDRVGMAGHFKDDIDAEASGFFHDDVVDVFFRGIKNVVGVHLAGDAGAMLVDFDGEDGSRAHGFGDGDGEQADGSASGDGDSFGGNFSGENRVDGVAKRIEDRSVFSGNGGVELPDVRFGNDDVFGEGSVGVDADDLDVLADVGFAGAALQALAASDVHFGGDEVSLFDAGDFIAEGGDFAAELVAGDERRVNAVLRPAVPVVNVEVGAADGGHFDFDEDLVAAEGGNFYFANVGARGCFRLDHRQHCCRHDCLPMRLIYAETQTYDSSIAAAALRGLT
jgi:hypothetical protein